MQKKERLLEKRFQAAIGRVEILEGVVHFGSEFLLVGVLDRGGAD